MEHINGLEIVGGKVRIPIPCPDGIMGCAVCHYKWISLEEYENMQKKDKLNRSVAMMKRKGQITYELSEEEYNRIVRAVRDIKYFFDHDEDKDDAERGIYDLDDIFDDRDY